MLVYNFFFTIYRTTLNILFYLMLSDSCDNSKTGKVITVAHDGGVVAFYNLTTVCRPNAVLCSIVQTK